MGFFTGTFKNFGARWRSVGSAASVAPEIFSTRLILTFFKAFQSIFMPLGILFIYSPDEPSSDEFWLNKYKISISYIALVSSMEFWSAWQESTLLNPIASSPVIQTTIAEEKREQVKGILKNADVVERISKSRYAIEAVNVLGKNKPIVILTAYSLGILGFFLPWITEKKTNSLETLEIKPVIIGHGFKFLLGVATALGAVIYWDAAKLIGQQWVAPLFIEREIYDVRIVPLLCGLTCNIALAIYKFDVLILNFSLKKQYLTSRIDGWSALGAISHGVIKGYVSLLLLKTTFPSLDLDVLLPGFALTCIFSGSAAYINNSDFKDPPLFIKRVHQDVQYPLLESLESPEIDAPEEYLDEPQRQKDSINLTNYSRLRSPTFTGSAPESLTSLSLSRG